MFSLDTMSNAIEYIELNLTEPLEMSAIAEVAYYSPFHFQRLFQMLTNQTLGDYIRNRRMSCAYTELLTSHEKILDIALKYQYESPEAFTRAFKKLFAYTPSQIRKNRIQVKLYPKLSVQVRLTAESPLKYQIVQKDGFYITGYKRSFTANEIMAGKAYPQFWEEKKDEMAALLEKHHVNKRIGAGAYRENNQNIYDATIGVMTKDRYDDSLYVAPSKWVVFKENGPLNESLHKLWSRIFLEWFPKTSFQHSGCTEIEVFPIGDSTCRTYEYEVWIPLKGALHET